MNNQNLDVKNKNRIHLLDFLRGTAIFVMIVTHLIFDIAYLFDSKWAQVSFDFIEKYASIFSAIFVGVSGVCAALGRDPAKRGATVFLYGCLVTVVTAVFMPDIIILNDVLILLGFCMLTYSVTEKFLKKIPKIAGIILFLFLFVISWNVGEGYFGIEGLFKIQINPYFYEVDWLYPLGIHSDKFMSGNYYPIFPWIFLFMACSYIGRHIKEKGAPDFAKVNFCPPINFLGRHSLIIYLLHQPIFFGILWVIGETVLRG
ncbi:MAG: DUF1624 domain-containing protein [Clostridia bacterium]|nr:DUF1624 domain-containing protein [Clostridia bacterium]